MSQPQEPAPAPRDPVEKLPATTSFAKDADASRVAKAMRRYRMEQERHRKAMAKADAMPDGDRKDARIERIMNDLDPALFAAETGLIERVFALCPPVPGYYCDQGASVVQLRDCLIVCTCSFDADGNRSEGRGDGDAIIIPIASTARIVVDRECGIPDARRERRKKEERAADMIRRLRHNNPDLN